MRKPRLYRCDDCRHEAFYDAKEFKKPVAVKCVNCGGIHLESIESDEVPEKKVFRRWVK